MSAADLETLRTLHAAATPGPWIDAPHGARKDCRCVMTEGAGRGRDYGEFIAMYVTRDAALIAAAVNALPDLLAIAETHHQLAAKVEAVEAILAAWEAWDGSPGPDGQMHPDSSSPHDRDRLRAALNAGVSS